MKKLIFLSLTIVVVSACQQPAPKQYFTDSPEIQNTKKGLAAYLSQDWDTFRGLYADTAQAYMNTMVTGISIDSLVSRLQEDHGVFSNIGISGPDNGDPIYEMIVTDEGDKWVHFWGQWKGTMNATGDEITTVVHLAHMYVDGQIVLDAAVFDTGPAIMAMQAASAAAEGDGSDDDMD